MGFQEVQTGYLPLPDTPSNSSESIDTQPEAPLLGDQPKKKKRALTIFSAAICIINLEAGSGMMACPRATINAGWMGFVLFVLCGSMSAFNGILLTWSRSIIEERYPEYNGHVRSPFAEIATKAFGRPGRMLFNFCIFMSHFGASVVNMLLCAELMESFSGWSRCFCIPLIAFCFMPSSCLPSPAKFRWFSGFSVKRHKFGLCSVQDSRPRLTMAFVTVQCDRSKPHPYGTKQPNSDTLLFNKQTVAPSPFILHQTIFPFKTTPRKSVTFLSSAGTRRKIIYMGLMAAMVACLCCIIRLSMWISEMKEPAVRTPPSLQTFSLGLATIMFSFAGAGALPTIQNDMADRSKFTRSVFLGYGGLIVLFSSMSALGFTALGDKLSANIINSLPDGDFRKISQLAFTISLITATYTLINPVFRQVEGPLKIEGPDMSLKQVLVRTVVIGLMVLVGLTVPSFDKILNLLGSTTIGVLAFIMPPVFYLRLVTQHQEGWPERKVSGWQKVAVPVAILLSIGGTGCALKAALQDLASAEAISGSCLIPM
ncbi:amino acid transporter AVT3B-like isoform X1 [Amphibalanus amphitrite]|uniref:amino acid transporter AVT3B-like isoform X1 n=1 Tax=Amphibalanus amphitrite TaxID=1232801 RepID=UPI001C91EB22|nr:amino acid transporter AVT3B-like isoform X1 [Amphibalanus amphitrite]